MISSINRNNNASIKQVDFNKSKPVEYFQTNIKNLKNNLTSSRQTGFISTIKNLFSKIFNFFSSINEASEEVVGAGNHLTLTEQEKASLPVDDAMDICDEINQVRQDFKTDLTSTESGRECAQKLDSTEQVIKSVVDYHVSKELHTITQELKDIFLIQHETSQHIVDEIINITAEKSERKLEIYSNKDLRALAFERDKRKYILGLINPILTYRPYVRDNLSIVNNLMELKIRMNSEFADLHQCCLGIITKQTHINKNTVKDIQAKQSNLGTRSASNLISQVHQTLVEINKSDKKVFEVNIDGEKPQIDFSDIDPISTEDLTSLLENPVSEYVLLRNDSKHYMLYLRQSISDLMGAADTIDDDEEEKENKPLNPMTRKEITSEDIIQGEKLLEVLRSAKPAQS